MFANYEKMMLWINAVKRKINDNTDMFIDGHALHWIYDPDLNYRLPSPQAVLVYKIPNIGLKDTHYRIIRHPLGLES